MSSRRSRDYKAQLMGKQRSAHNGVVTGAKLFERPRPGTSASVVILDRVDPEVEPPYCTHGKATCINCDHWVWLGHESYKVVANREAYALCMECAVEILPKDSRPVRNLNDTLGQHD